MAVFAYRAREPSGRETRGTLQADNRQAALHQLDQKALLPLEVKEASEQAGRRGRVRLAALAGFYQQLADLLKAGVPILRSLDVLSKQKGSPGLTVVVQGLRDNVAGGETLADSMARHPSVFPALHVSIVAAGEKGGFLEDALANVGQFVERQDELLSRVLSALIYPAVLAIAGIGVFIAVLTFLVPQLEPLLANLPTRMWLTDVLLGLSRFVRTHYVISAAIPIGLGLGLIWLFRQPAARRWLDRHTLKAPLIGPVFTMVALCRFCRVLGTLIRNGIPILQALKVAQGSAGNIVIAQQIELAAENVRKGETLAGPLSASALFPADLMDMIAVGEESNQLDRVLVNIADTQEARVARRVDALVRLIEPFMLIILAVFIALVAVALLVPVLTASSGAR